MSQAQQKGFVLDMDSLTLNSRLKQTFSSPNDGLIRRPISSWSVKKFQADLRQCVIHLCSVDSSQPTASQPAANSPSGSTVTETDVPTDVADGSGSSRLLECQYLTEDLSPSDVKPDLSSNDSHSSTSTDQDTDNGSKNTIKKTKLASVERVTYTRTDDQILNETDNSDTVLRH